MALYLVLAREASASDYGHEHRLNSAQRQIFGGVPSTEVKAIVMRDQLEADSKAQVADNALIQGVVDKVVNNGMYIPVYRASTGELVLTADQFDQLGS